MEIFMKYQFPNFIDGKIMFAFFSHLKSNYFLSSKCAPWTKIASNFNVNQIKHNFFSSIEHEPKCDLTFLHCSDDRSEEERKRNFQFYLRNYFQSYFFRFAHTHTQHILLDSEKGIEISLSSRTHYFLCTIFFRVHVRVNFIFNTRNLQLL